MLNPSCLLLGFFFLMIVPAYHSQTKIMEYDTGLPWEDHQYLTGGTTLVGKDFLVVAVNRSSSPIPNEQTHFIFDLK